MLSNRDELALAQIVFRQAEAKLKAQLQTALAADQRAMTLAAIFATASVALFGVAMLAIDRPEAIWSLAGGGMGAGASFFVGAWLCVQAAWPVDFHLPGNLPESWWCDGVEDKALAECFRNEAEHYQDDIKDNREVMKKNARSAELGARFGVFAPIVGAVAGIALQLAAPYFS